MIKATDGKATTNILNGKKLKTFPLRSETGQGCQLSLFSCNIILEILARAIRQEKGIQIGKKKVKLSLYARDIILYIENLRGTWVPQSVKRPTSAQVMISWFVSLSPALGSLLSAWSPPLSLPFPCLLSISLSLSQK